MTQPQIVQPEEGTCPFCWSPTSNAGACDDCIEFFNERNT